MKSVLLFFLIFVVFKVALILGEVKVSVDVLDDENQHGLSFPPNWFIYVENLTELPGKLNDDYNVSFEDWSKIEQSPKGVWALFNQVPWESHVENAVVEYSQGALNIQHVSVSYYAYGNYSFEIYSGYDNETFTADCWDGCEFVYKTDVLDFGVEDLKRSFTINFTNPASSDSFILIDKIVADTGPPPTPEPARTRVPVFPSTDPSIPPNVTGSFACLRAGFLPIIISWMCLKFLFL